MSLMRDGDSHGISWAMCCDFCTAGKAFMKFGQVKLCQSWARCKAGPRLLLNLIDTRQVMQSAGTSPMDIWLDIWLDVWLRPLVQSGQTSPFPADEIPRTTSCRNRKEPDSATYGASLAFHASFQKRSAYRPQWADLPAGARRGDRGRFQAPSGAHPNVGPPKGRSGRSHAVHARFQPARSLRIFRMARPRGDPAASRLAPITLRRCYLQGVRWRG